MLYWAGSNTERRERLERIKPKHESATRVCCQRQAVFGEILTDVNHRTQEVIIHMRFRKFDLERRIFVHFVKREGQKVDIAAIFQYRTGFTLENYNQLYFVSMSSDGLNSQKGKLSTDIMKSILNYTDSSSRPFTGSF